MVTLLTLTLATALAQDTDEALPQAMDVGRPLLVHIPVTEAAAGKDLQLTVGSSDFGEMAQVELFYRPMGEGSWSSLGFARSDSGDWVVTVPGRELSAPGLEYYIASTEGLSKGDRFASAASPHPVQIGEETLKTVARRELDRFEGQRSRVAVSYEYAGFGDQDLAPAPDRWHSVDADFSYRLLRGVRQVRLGGSWTRGDTWVVRNGQQVPRPGVGVDYGFAEIEIAPLEWFGVTGQLQLGAGPWGFVVGGEGGLRLGFDPGTHVRLEGGYLNSVGGRGQLTLAWATVPKVPMRAAIEVTTWPNNSAPAVRGWYGLQLPLGGHADLDLRGGYEARSAALGGPVLGAGLSWSY